MFLPVKSPGQRCLAGYSPWGCKESDVTEHLTQIMVFAVYFEMHPKKMAG